MRPTIMEVDIKRYNENMDNIQKYVGNKIMIPVIKANGYGTYINKRLDVIDRFDIVGLATVDEGVEVRKLGYQKEIFVLNEPYVDDIESIVKYDIAVGISSIEFLKEAIKCNDKIRVHLEIETGMNRTGIKLNELDDFISIIKSSNNIIVEGVYTHLSSADYDEEYTLRQLRIFKEAVEKIKENFDTIKYVHSEASNGLLNYNNADLDVSNAVRPGLIMYGYDTFDGVKEKLDIKPIAKLKSKVIFIKDVDENESISYSRRFKTTKKMRIATIPMGYADGLRRALSNKGVVVINGKKASIVGSVCMDSIMVDVTDIENVGVGTDVYFWDNENYTLDEMSDLCDTINYEILCTISDRVKRVFID